MAFHISIPPPLSIPGANRRRHGRLVCDGISCCIGEVLEFSGSGARIRTAFDRIRPGEETSIKVQGLEGTVHIRVVVVWVAPEGVSGPDQQMLAGLKYIELDDHARRALTELARVSASNPTVGR
ncbi:MAG TPA: PilZ domain-containing protein [Phycisphaerales bacterium]|nr:PilZ domain-containing protein [Phycisphaerales bacterium]